MDYHKFTNFFSDKFKIIKEYPLIRKRVSQWKEEIFNISNIFNRNDNEAQLIIPFLLSCEYTDEQIKTDNIQFEKKYLDIIEKLSSKIDGLTDINNLLFSKIENLEEHNKYLSDRIFDIENIQVVPSEPPLILV